MQQRSLGEANQNPDLLEYIIRNAQFLAKIAKHTKKQECAATRQEGGSWQTLSLRILGADLGQRT